MHVSALANGPKPGLGQRISQRARTLRIQLFVFALLIASLTIGLVVYLESQAIAEEDKVYIDGLSHRFAESLEGLNSEVEKLELIALYLRLPNIERIEFWQSGSLNSFVLSNGRLSRVVTTPEAELRLERFYPLNNGAYVRFVLSPDGQFGNLHQHSLNVLLITLSAFVLAILFLLFYLEGPIRAIRKASRYAASLSSFPEQNLKLEKVAIEFEELETALNGVAGQLKIKEQSLQHNNDRLEAILNHAVDGIMTINERAELELVNPASQRIFGYAVADMVGQPIARFIEGLDAATIDPSKTHLMTIVAKHKEGRQFPIEVSQSELWMQDKPLKVVIVRDLSERHLYEQALRESEAKTRKLSLVASRTSNAVLITDHEARIEWINEGFVRLTGYNLLDTKGRNLLEILFAKASDSSKKAYFAEQLREKAGCQLQLHLIDKQERPYWLDLELQPMLDQEEKFTGFMVIATNITEQKEAQKLLKQQRDFALTVMTTAAQGITVINREWHYEYVNPAFEAITGFKAKDVLGKSPESFMPQNEDVWADYKKRCQNNKPASFEYGLTHAKGHKVDILVTSVPRFQGDEFLGVIATVTDITQSKQENKELLAAKEAAEAANKAKNEFLSRMSHELRTPLNAILGFAQLLELDELNQDQSENVDRILGAGRHLLDLINEVLDISRIETGSISLTIEPVLCERIVKESITLMQPLAKSRRVKLELDTESDKSLSVMSDHQRLKQVLINLLSNAIKYNHEAGNVYLSWQAKDGQLRFCVRDTGPGIPESKLDRLFVPFDRLDAEQTSVEGSGIGLALTRRLVEVMGGKISVSSEQGKGSSFFIELPLAPIPVEDQHLDHLLGDAQLRVVYVEDDLPNVALVRKIFSKLPNTQLRTAMQGELGLKLIREDLPQLVLLDLNLPDISGEEVLRQLKANAETQSIPVIILSADATETSTARLLEAGAFAYLYKPVNIPKLMQLVEGIRFDQKGQDQLSAPVETIDLLRLAQKILKDRPLSQQLRPEQVQVFQDLQSIVSLTSHSWKSDGAGLQGASEQLLACLARVAEGATDPTGRHSQRVATMASLTAEQLGCDEKTVKLMVKAAQLHDLGAMAVTDTILLKPDALTDSERSIMQLHCEIGADMLADGNSELFKMAADIARSHHERWDGTGYPHQMSEDSIPLAARIVAVADVYDALLQSKPYKKAWTNEEALDYITEQAASQFDPDVVVAFLQANHDNLMFEQTFDRELSL